MKKSIRKRVVSFMVALCFLLGGIGVLNFGTISLNHASADVQTQQNLKTGYYYTQLSSSEKKFYDAIAEMKTEGVLKQNASYDLISNNVVSSSEVQEYANGNSSLLKMFASAKDAYYLDHPEVFYVNFDNLALNLSKKANGSYVATIGANRTNSYLAEGFSTQTVQTAIDLFNGNDGLKTLLPEEELPSDYEEIVYVNSKLIELTEYGFSDDATGAFVRSAYGAVNGGLLVSEGYAKTFKACMDELGIECVQAVGYKTSEEGDAFEPRSWNYVKIETEWYAVDVSANVQSLTSSEECLLIGSNEFFKSYIEDCVLSNHGKVFECPTLTEKNIANAPLNITTSYSEKALTVKVSYNGKSATELVNDGYYLVMFYPTVQGGVINNGAATAISAKEVGQNVTGESTEIIDASKPMVKVGVTTVAPDQNNMFYSNLTDQNLICYEIIENELYGTTSDVTNPKTTVSAKSLGTDTIYQNASEQVLQVEDSYEITLTFETDVKKAIDALSAGVRVYSLESANISTHVLIENVVWDSQTPNVVKFTFTPSKLYMHNGIEYKFATTNLIRSDGNAYIEPMSASIKFERQSFTLSRVISGDRLFIDVCAVPTLIDDADLNFASGEWQTSDGVVYSEDHITQLTLVSSKPSAKENKDMIAGVKEFSELDENELLSSESFNLEINLCAKVQTIPRGSYLKIAFGFPEGYSYKSLSQGVKFVVYHFNDVENGLTNYANPEVLDCTATEYGLVVTVDSLSSFMVAAVKDSAVTTSKTIYARTINNFGKIENLTEVFTSKLVNTVESNASTTYLITPETGYEIDYVLLNGKDITDKVEDGELDISDADLVANNTLEVAFVLTEIAEDEVENGVSNLNKNFAQNQKLNKVISNTSETPEKNNTVVIVLIIVGSVVVAVAATLTVIVVVKKKASKK